MRFSADFYPEISKTPLLPERFLHAALFGLVCLGFLASQATQAQTPISEAVASHQPSASASYTEGGDFYKFGVVPAGTTGNDLVVTSFEIDLGLGDGLESFAITSFVDRINIVRQDNAQISGNKQLLFYEDADSAGSNFNLRPGLVQTMEEALLNEVINRGTDNIFANEGGTNLNNIERVDFIVDAGLTVPADTRGDGFVILERGGNDDFKIAAITSLDGSGNPDAFGPEVSVSATDWGGTQWSFVTQVMASAIPADNLVQTTQVGTQTISGIYFSFFDLGASENDVIYGYSLVGGDVTTVSADWVDTSVEANFPRDTTAASNAAGGLDLVAGGSISSRNPEADVALVKTVDDETPVVGQDVTFTISVENLGPFSTISTEVSDVLPSGYTFVSSNPSAGSYNAMSGIWDIGGMVVSETQTLQITATVEPDGDYLNSATVSDCCNDPDLNNNTDSAEVSPRQDFGDAPDSYGSSLAENGPRHRVGGPWMPNIENAVGSPGTNDTVPTVDATPDADANTDAAEQGVILADFKNLLNSGGVTCDGVFLENTIETFFYCAAVRVANPTSATARLVGWVDFAGDGTFTGAPDRSSPTIRRGASGFADLGGGTCENVGASPGDALNAGFWGIPPHCEGVVVMVWQYGSGDTVTNNKTFARFRISTDTRDGFDTNPSQLGFLDDGEVEDHLMDAGTIPVSIHAFESKFVRSGLEVTWSTASETHNKGFYIWGETSDGGFELLTPEMIPSEASGAVQPKSYSVLIPGIRSGEVRDLIIAAVDYQGREEMYGYFHTGKAFGQNNPPAMIDWGQVARETQARIDQVGMVARGDLVQPFHDSRSNDVTAADFLVKKEGMYRITYEDLLRAGLDLADVNPRAIAVSVAGRPVPRLIETHSRRGSVSRSESLRPALFGPGSSILFWGDRPALPEAQYIDHQVYRVSRDPASAKKATAYAGRVSRSDDQQRISRTVADQTGYHFSNPNPDPWYMRRLRNWGSNHRSHTAIFDVPDAVDRFGQAEVLVQLAGLTSLPDTPTHRIKVFLNGRQVADEVFIGQEPHQIRAPLRGVQLLPGINEVEVRSVSLEGINSITLLDSIELAWTEANVAVENRILFEPRHAGAVNGVVVSGLDTRQPVHAFARTEQGLIHLESETFGRGQVIAAVPDSATQLRVWMSGDRELIEPAALGPVPANQLLEGLGELVIIAHPAFLPMNEREDHPLNDFVQRRRSQGWTVSVRSVADIQLQYGGGMPLPGAINSFLAAALEANKLTHVLLVGSDSYDYRDHLGLGSISFIPTHYAPTYFVHFTPSDALLADVTGDGLSDLAIGRWPVRTRAGLAATVQKVMDWETNMMGTQSAVWLTDMPDPRMASFTRQAERMADLLVDQGGWSASSFDRISYEDYGSPAAMRSDFFDALASGRALTGFTGHGSPTVWSFQSVLAQSQVADLDNEGFPTLISTSACYTTYFTSPHATTLAHRLMNGMRLDGAGNPIPAGNGAVAVHGAATLSNLAANEVFVREVLVQKLSGATLGEAVLAARQAAAARGISDLVINWTLLGDPTLRLQ